ncbi:disulfide bond formation protein DsbB [Catenovulum maritimum]|uniref:Disulfide bond formation protein B n=1 Tax=Catenovulum maritimum TaxID=1513271 RepID=A0A0J8JKZ6_9ALTE|nr:disulfide bond formation protein DsbB [Catenovulum maritimum]KMT65216.1 disulfide bond formation protein B [Catenovulum maritimum]
MQTTILNQAFSNQRLPWLLVASSIFFLEIAALVFQYGLGYEPCIKCIYQRLALWALLLSCLPALIAPKLMLTRLISYCSAIFFASWGYKIAAEHVNLQTNPDPFAASCELYPRFPEWFAPDVWLPNLFEPRGDCAAIEWELFGLSMPMWMQVIFALYLVTFVAVPAYHLIRFKQI